jgi:hypothetical protein
MARVSYAEAMRRWVVVALAIATGACRDPEVAKLQAIRDEVCACKTASCGEDAMKRLPQHDGATEPRPIAANRRTQVLAREMMDCMARLYLSDRPSTDPDAEPEPE